MNATAQEVNPERPRPADAAPSLSLIDGLLRDRRAALDAMEDPAKTGHSARTLVITIMLGTGVLGATLGMYRGGIQILYAGIKLPLMILLTAGICAPAFSALKAALYGQTHIKRDVLVVLGSLALASLLAAACAPVLMLAMTLDVSYHRLILLTVACCGVAGLGGLTFFFAALRRWSQGRHRALALALFMVFGAVGSQMTWTLRPFLVRPRTVEVPFVRAIEGSFIQAVFESTLSAQGRYSRRAAPVPQPDVEDLREVLREDRR